MLNWVVAGIGDIATRRVIPAILSEPRSRLYGVVTRDPAKGAGYGGKVWTDFAAAVRDDAVDAVYVALPVALHAPLTVAALVAGKHVLCEKPMALDYAAACGMVKAAKESAGLLGIGYYRRSYPKVRRAAELIAAGAIGQPVMAFATTHNWFNAEGGHRAWLLDRALAGGGPLYDTACHRVDLFNLLFGRPEAVAAQLSNVVFQGEVEDAATVLVDYEGGARGIVDARRHSRVARDEFRVIGTEGEIELSPLNGPELVYPRGAEELPAHENLHYPLVENFVSAVLEGAPLASSGETALPTDWVLGQAAAHGRASAGQD